MPGKQAWRAFWDMNCNMVRLYGAMGKPCKFETNLKQIAAANNRRFGKMVRKTLVLAILMGAVLPIGVKAAVLVPHVDLTYEGAFSMPSTVETDKCFQWQYVAGNMTYNPKGDPSGPTDGYPGSLIVTGRSGCPTIGEINIPIPKKGVTNPADLNQAAILQPLTNVGNGDLDSGLPNGGPTAVGIGDPVLVPSASGDKLMIVTHEEYAISSDRPELLAAINVNFSTSVGFSGWYKLANVNIAEYQHYAFTVPQWWADQYTSGRNVIVGCNRQNSGGSFGATMYAISPWTASSNPPAKGSTFASTQLISYGNTSNMNDYGFSNIPSDMVWVSDGTKNSIIANGLYFGRWRLASDQVTTDWTKNANGWYYGIKHPEGAGGKGYHLEPYSQALLLYNPDDLANAAKGAIKPNQVQPYAFYDWSQYAYDNPYHTTLDPKKSAGIAYDATDHILYVAEPASTATAGRVIVHVFSVQDNPGSLDTSPPTAPSSLVAKKVSDSEVDLSWTGSTDDKTGVTYVIYVNGYPVLRTTQTSYQYTYVKQWENGAAGSEGWASTYKFVFRVAAQDKYYNTSQLSNASQVQFLSVPSISSINVQ